MPKNNKKSKDSKRIWNFTYLVRVHGYGGELMVGTVTEDFAKYWEKRDSEEMLSHLRSYGDDDEFPDSPDVTTSLRFAQPDELADVLHTELVMVDATVHIQEIHQPTDSGAFPALIGDPVIFELPDGVKGGVEFDYTVMTKRKSALKSSKVRPVLSSIYWEAGDFLTGVIQTDDYFDKARLGLGLVRTDHGTFVNTWTYDGKVVPMSYVEDGVKVKGTEMVLGWLPIPVKRPRSST
jgi:hypothetical protein